MKKIINVWIGIFVILTSVYLPVAAKVNEIDVETNLRARQETMLSGENNHISIEFKITGPKTIIKQYTFELRYDPLVEIDEDYLINNIPKDFHYKLNNNSVLFEIEQMEAGKFYEIPIVFSVKNGLTINGTNLNFDLIRLDYGDSSVLANASVIANASSPLKINKEYVGLADEKLNNTLGIAPGLSGRWKTKAVIPKNEYGQMFIKEETKIKITEVYDAETFEYVRTEGAIKPSVEEEGVLVWEFLAPNYEEQFISDNLFYQEFDVVYKVKDDLKLDNKLDNQGSKVTLEFINIEEELLIDSDEGKTTLYPSAEDTPEVEGNWWIPGHFGPVNAFGDFSTDFEAMNTRPTVYEWATLTYAHQIAALEYGETERYKHYNISYFINEHLFLEEIKTPGRFLYRPNNEHGDGTYLEEQPIFNVHFYDELDNLLASFEHVRENMIISREDILGENNEHINIRKVVYSAVEFVPGMIVDNPEVNTKTGFTDLPTYTFSIAPTWKNDAVDNMYQLKNEKMIEVERKFPQNYKEIYDFRDGVQYDYIVDGPNGKTERYVGWHFLSAPRWANVTEEEQAYIPTVKNSIELLNHRDGLVTAGDNTLRIRLDNKRVSLGAVLGNVESFFIIPKTIEVNLDDIVSGVEVAKNSLDQYNDIYIVKWHNNLLTPRDHIYLDLQVKVSDDIQSLNMFHYTKLSDNKDFHVPVVENPVLQDSFKINSPQNLYEYIKSDQVVLTKNNYTVLSDYYIKTEKYVKTKRDVIYQKKTTMFYDDIVTYKLQFENKKGVEVTRFGLIDILPHKGDVGITNNVNRGSEFDLGLNGEILVDDRFEVLYSESRKPSRDALNEMVDKKDYMLVVGGDAVTWKTKDEVSDWNSINSFLVILKEGELIGLNETFDIQFDAKISNEQKVQTDSYAHNSFALTANGSPIVEPLQVSVKLVDTDETPKTEEKPPNIVPENPTDSKPSSTPSTGLVNLRNRNIFILILSIVMLYLTNKYKKTSLNIDSTDKE